MKLTLTEDEYREAAQCWLAWEFSTTLCALAALSGPDGHEEYIAQGQRAHQAITRLRAIYGVDGSQTDRALGN